MRLIGGKKVGLGMLGKGTTSYRMMRTLAWGVRVLWLWRTNSHWLQKSCGEKGTAWPLSKWERAWGQERAPEREPDPCLDRLLLLFWAHYIKDDPHLLCTGSPQVITFYRYKGKNVANYFKEKDVIDQGEKWLNWLHSILGRFSTDFRKLL